MARRGGRKKGGTIVQMVRTIMADGKWWTTAAIAALLKDRGHNIERKHVLNAVRQLRGGDAGGQNHKGVRPERIVRRGSDRSAEHRLIQLPAFCQDRPWLRLEQLATGVRQTLAELEPIAKLVQSELVHSLSSGELRRIAVELRRSLELAEAVGESTRCQSTESGAA